MLFPGPKYRCFKVPPPRTITQVDSGAKLHPKTIFESPQMIHLHTLWRLSPVQTLVPSPNTGSGITSFNLGCLQKTCISNKIWVRNWSGFIHWGHGSLWEKQLCCFQWCLWWDFQSLSPYLPCS